jgi:hypothetical protein
MDNDGSFLTFPQFILQVDDSSDCTIGGSSCLNQNNNHFVSQLVDSIANVSDNTRNCNTRCPIVSKSTSHLNNKTISPKVDDTHPTVSYTPTHHHDTNLAELPLPVIAEDSSDTIENNPTDLSSTLQGGK